MGHTVKPLAKKEISKKSIFNNRFVIELCEKIHVHYRSLRLNLSVRDWIEMCEGFIKAYQRWKDRGAPDVGLKHVELCRKTVGKDTHHDDIQINLNRNLYPHNAGRIFSEGANFDEPYYIHLKIRDMRVELSLAEYQKLSEAVKEANGKLADSDTRTLLQEA